jgi:hypothetical protein
MPQKPPSAFYQPHRSKTDFFLDYFLSRFFVFLVSRIGRKKLGGVFQALGIPFRPSWRFLARGVPTKFHKQKFNFKLEKPMSRAFYQKLGQKD